MKCCDDEYAQKKLSNYKFDCVNWNRIDESEVKLNKREREKTNAEYHIPMKYLRQNELVE